jgi:hypothetical protein
VLVESLKNKNHVKNSQEKKERLERKDLGRNNFLSKKDRKEKLASKSSPNWTLNLMAIVYDCN